MLKKIILILVISLIGCRTATVYWKLLPMGQIEDKRAKFQTSLSQDWMKLETSPYFVITRDGVVLNTITVIYQTTESKIFDTGKVFGKDMTLEELSEVEKNFFKSDKGIIKIEFLNDQPKYVSGCAAAFLEYKYIREDNLEMRGISYTFIKERNVYTIRYQAPEQYYFKKYYHDFEEFIKKFKIL